MTLIREVPPVADRPPSESSSESSSERGLRLAVRVLAATLVVGVLAFAAVYYLGQRVDPGPSLAQRQVTAVEQQVRRAPNSIPARLGLADAYQRDHRLDDALAQYDEILRVDAGNRAALLGRGGALLTKGDLDGAAASYRKITSATNGGEFAAADPQLEEAHYFLAQIASRQGKPQQTITEAMAALGIDPTDSDAWYLLGAARLAEGQLPQAVAALRQALQFVPTGWCDPYARLAEAYQRMGNTAEREYAEAMSDFCAKRPEQAERRLTALTDGPAALDAMAGLATIAEAAGRDDQAASWYRRMLAADPGNATAAAGLSRLGAGPRVSSTHRVTAPSTPVSEGLR
jgi:tetratricopeptide (TPR) repeat protein